MSTNVAYSTLYVSGLAGLWTPARAEPVEERVVGQVRVVEADRKRGEERVAVEVLAAVTGIHEPASMTAVEVHHELVAVGKHVAR